MGVKCERRRLQQHFNIKRARSSALTFFQVIACIRYSVLEALTFLFLSLNHVCNPQGAYSRDNWTNLARRCDVNGRARLSSSPTEGTRPTLTSRRILETQHDERQTDIRVSPGDRPLARTFRIMYRLHMTTRAIPVTPGHSIK